MGRRRRSRRSSRVRQTVGVPCAANPGGAFGLIQPVGGRGLSEEAALWEAMRNQAMQYGFQVSQSHTCDQFIPPPPHDPSGEVTLDKHQFHGRKSDRRYIDRWQIALEHDFDPDTDIMKNAHGVVEGELFFPGEPLAQRLALNVWHDVIEESQRGA